MFFVIYGHAIDDHDINCCQAIHLAAAEGKINILDFMFSEVIMLKDMSCRSLGFEKAVTLVTLSGPRAQHQSIG